LVLLGEFKKNKMKTFGRSGMHLQPPWHKNIL
jgi:hypothetical protein